MRRGLNASYLNVMANLNLILSIIGSIIIFIKFSIIKDMSIYGLEHNSINWIGIISGLGVLIGGFTLFFLLETIVDIYWEVEK